MVSLDDMTIGPRAAWPNAQRFYADCAAAFRASVDFDLPDGTKMDDLLMGFARRTPPLVEISGSWRMRKCAVCLTATGAEVHATL
ncbi:MAG: hypothetical protein AAFN94_16170 [Pseudomonadota bacterium]